MHHTHTNIISSVRHLPFKYIRMKQQVFMPIMSNTKGLLFTHLQLSFRIHRYPKNIIFIKYFIIHIYKRISYYVSISSSVVIYMENRKELKFEKIYLNLLTALFDFWPLYKFSVLVCLEIHNSI